MDGSSGRPWWVLPALIIVLLTIAPSPLLAMEASPRIDLTQHPIGYLALLIFFVAYGFVAVEKAIQLRNARRAIDLHEGDKIDEDAFKALIHAAVALNTRAARPRSQKRAKSA